ncbi:hypothetical protein LJC01_01990 [Clostridiaceae bacterium OttesenSCG-928-D20]|nr:hypothetical protein [Clostridiaceae bacterium OttesenSCG-928-D20]
MAKPKRKTAGQVQILPWLSARHDCKEGRFIQVSNSLRLSKKYQCLSHGARGLFLDMALESGGKRQFIFPKSAAEKYGYTYQTFRRCLDELKEKQFITCIEDNHTTRKPNIYEFNLCWKA